MGARRIKYPAGQGAQSVQARRIVQARLEAPEVIAGAGVAHAYPQEEDLQSHTLENLNLLPASKKGAREQFQQT